MSHATLLSRHATPSASSPLSSSSPGLLVDPELFFSRRVESGTGRTALPKAQPHGVAKQPLRAQSGAATLVKVCSLVIFVTIMLVCAEMAMASPQPVSAPVVANTISVTAQPGDSVWSLARRAQPIGDIRPMVDSIVAARGSAVLWVGDVVAIPSPG